MKCRYCGGEVIELKKQRQLELATMKIIHTYHCKQCRRTGKRTEIYLRVQGVPLEAKSPEGGKL